MMDGIEKHLMTNIYTKWVEFVGGARPYSQFFSCIMYRVFSPASSDDEMKDLLLQRRFRMLNWLEPHHLDVPLNLQNPEVQEQIIKGQQGKERERERERERGGGGGGGGEQRISSHHLHTQASRNNLINSLPPPPPSLSPQTFGPCMRRRHLKTSLLVFLAAALSFSLLCTSPETARLVLMSFCPHSSSW